MIREYIFQGCFIGTSIKTTVELFQDETTLGVLVRSQCKTYQLDIKV